MAHTDRPRSTDRIDRRIMRKTRRPSARRQGTRSAVIATARKEG